MGLVTAYAWVNVVTNSNIFFPYGVGEEEKRNQDTDSVLTVQWRAKVEPFSQSLSTTSAALEGSTNVLIDQARTYCYASISARGSSNEDGRNWQHHETARKLFGQLHTDAKQENREASVKRRGQAERERGAQNS